MLKSKICQCCNKVFAKDPRVNPKQWNRQRFCSDPCRRKKCTIEACERRGFGSETAYYKTIMEHGSISAAARIKGVHTRTLERRLWIEGGYCGSCGVRPIAQEISSDKCKECRESWYRLGTQWRTSEEGQRYNYNYIRTEEYRARHREVGNRYSHTEKGWHASRSSFIRRRDRKKKVGDKGLSTKEVRLVREIYGNKCFVCGMTQEEHYLKYRKSLPLDHFNPLSAGHALTIDNVVLLCHSHNDSKSNQNPNDFFTPKQVREIKKIWETLCQRKRN